MISLQMKEKKGRKIDMWLICILIGFWMGIMFFVMVNSRTIRDLRKKRKRKEAEHPENKLQTTKIIVFSVMATYYITFLVGVWVVTVKDIYQISALFTFVGSVSVIALGFYCWKSKAENLLKIKKENPDISGTLSDFSNMASQ